MEVQLVGVELRAGSLLLVVFQKIAAGQGQQPRLPNAESVKALNECTRRCVRRLLRAYGRFGAIGLVSSFELDVIWRFVVVFAQHGLHKEEEEENPGPDVRECGLSSE